MCIGKLDIPLMACENYFSDIITGTSYLFQWMDFFGRFAI